MRTYEHTIETDRAEGTYFSIVHSSDAHIGAGNIDETLAQKVVKRIKEDDHCYWIETGDCCELITRTDPRFEAGDAPPWFDITMLRDPVKHQVARYAQIFGPVADKCLAIVSGNHEDSIHKHHDRDVYEEICDSMGLPTERRFGSGGFLRLRFVSGEKVYWRVTLFLHHGTASGKSKASVINELDKLPKAYQADVYCVGHAHKKVAFTDGRAKMDDVTGRLVVDKVAYSAAGSYMLSITEHANGRYNERKLMYPQDRGPVEIRLYPNIKDIRVVL